MRRYVTNDKERINRWICPLIKRDSLFTNFQALGIENEHGELIAGVVFSDYVENARCQTHCAGIGKRWLTRTFIKMCFDYGFRQAGCKVLVSLVDADNAESCRLTEHIGYKEAVRIKEGCGNSDLVVYVMYRNECKWLG